MKERCLVPLLAAAALCWIAAPFAAAVPQEEPPLPEGLQEKPAKKQAQKEEEPSLPEGLESGAEKEEEPALPAGLGGEKEAGGTGPGKAWIDRLRSKLPFDFTGFLEGRAGFRLQNDAYEKDMSLGEGRLQLEAERQWTAAAFHVTADLLYDPITDHHDVRLEKGEGWLDLREFNLALTPASFVDLKAGRQILTWGTGDLLFINDLFPKDWNSFFIGRDEEYLKAPSDAVKGSFFTDAFNVDVVYTPRFDPDRYIDGRRVSWFDDALDRRRGRDRPVRVDLPERWIENDEAAIRLYRNVEGYELALYGYRGYWKSPGGMDGATGLATFPRLAVYGASARGNVLDGIGNVEVGYYDSLDDRSGDDPLVRNSELRALAGYEQEVLPDFTTGFQYYVEWMMDHGAYRRTLPFGIHEKDEVYHVTTLRLTRLLMNQNLRLSLFTFFSPSDGDAYLRPRVSYKVDDHWYVEAGMNIFTGKDDYTFFGQFENNTNLYAAVRYSF